MWHEVACRLLLGVLVAGAVFLLGCMVWGKNVTVIADGRIYPLLQFQGTVADSLDKANVTLRRADIVNAPLNSPVVDGQRIRVARVEEEILISDQMVKFQTEKRWDPGLYPGQQKVVQKGTCGLTRNYIRVIYHDGQEVKRETIKKEMVRKSRPLILAYGARVTVSRGQVRPSRAYATRAAEAAALAQPIGNGRVVTAVATAYTHTGNRTATGIRPYVGVVAVDPRVIPLGTKLYVEGYGPAIAADTGGDIEGNRIDVFFDSRQQAMNWGRRQVKVHILK
ncbi:3D domain-containing protein [Desulfotomaculum nigrificans CO-1-SRB]|uniref:3D domain-containing protein n=1 Tax=Desulfotomaculum nigrificans (strain DSM 14880 / VKM B-2319 / CO-1-SRB) TaxID=868595 RepID=F6B3Z1_DESCC|nr:3D domain-containing protein [Desulfotomaculum nigrificans CO-1-SRB]